METPTKCPECGSEMKVTSATEKVTYKGEAVEVPNVSALRCAECGEAIITGEASVQLNDAFKELRARVEGVLSPRQVASIRNALGMTQRQAAMVLGGGKNGFQKYESGEQVPSRAMSVLLLVLSERPELKTKVEEFATKLEETAHHERAFDHALS